MVPPSRPFGDASPMPAKSLLGYAGRLLAAWQDSMTREPQPDTLFSNHVHTLAERYERALERCGADTLVIGSGTVYQRFLDDIPYPFRVNAHFNQWVPLADRPGCYVVFRPGETPRLLLHSPTDFWHKPPEPPQEPWTEAFRIESHASLADVHQALPQASKGLVYLGEACPWEDVPVRINPREMLDYLHYHRAWKTEYELACLREANHRGAAGHYAARDAFLNGASEFELYGAFCSGSGHTGPELPYPGIVALNEHGAILHYDALDREPPEQHRSFLIDAGASFRGYASDITRTWSHGDPAFRELIQAVDSLQQGLCSEVRPGVNFVQLHQRAHEAIAGVLAEWDLVRMTPETMVEQGVTRHFFPHGLGHWIGLQVHDVGGFLQDEDGTPAERPEAHPFLRLVRDLDADQTLTIEPGLYFIDSLLADLRERPEGRDVNWEQVERFRPFGGIRVEDDVRVTRHGVENMTRQAFAGAPEEISAHPAQG